MAQAGGFREDLFYRINVVSLRLPPLRERRDDIPLLVDHFLRLKAHENSMSPKTLSPEVVDCFMSYSWPGNVRELENLIERLTILSPHEVIGLKDLPEGMRMSNQVTSLAEEVLKGFRPLGEAVDEFERDLILKTLEKTGYNQTKAALLLGTSRRVLRYRMEKLRILPENVTAGQTKVS
jgi:DNA-binding NtrC family response regulator